MSGKNKIMTAVVIDQENYACALSTRIDKVVQNIKELSNTLAKLKVKRKCDPNNFQIQIEIRIVIIQINDVFSLYNCLIQESMTKTSQGKFIGIQQIDEHVYSTHNE